ncbi:hypothetical protein QX233_18545 [Chryseobacterium gambrini]|uniref:Uncharacterized protein n=1 Tax=Chryseobacterium gambrini TaxID=373672 RepID=A0AAJ1R5U7_9FLAO|nr:MULTISPECIES: hypothetical protein [Chryseobacterium]MDN4014475.1 hypothetical protein [Chryseobacterium gambrini]QWA37251.1 hypothetical protein KKI44_15095 [Chryseobacterium sp. ZHDP1]
MNTELIVTPEVQAVLDTIKNTGKSWHEMMLPDHPMYPQFARKLVVTGFNTPDMEGGEDRIYVNVRQYLIIKDGNIIHKRLKMPDWMIHEGNVEQVMGKDGFLKGIYRTTDDEGLVTDEKEAILKAPSVQYIRFLIKTKAAHLVDILQQFMGLYTELFDKEINEI